MTETQVTPTTEVVYDVLSAVFYVDGSCRPTNPGYAGWGYHGYFYKQVVPSPVTIEMFMHTSHGYIRAGKEVHKSAVMVKPLGYADGYGSIEGSDQSNNVGEIAAVLYLLLYLDSYPNLLAKLTIYTDSTYVKNALMQWMPTWISRNWTTKEGEPVKNAGLFKNINDLMGRFKNRGTTISVHWIEGHNDHLGNDRADLLAGIGAGYSMLGQKLTDMVEIPVNKFLKTDADRHPYLSHQRLYFNSIPQHNEPGLYYLAQSKDQDFVVGKGNSDTGFAVVSLKDPVPEIEIVKQRQFEISGGNNVIVMLKLDALFSKWIYPWIHKHGSLPIVPRKNTFGLSLLDRKHITIEMQPPAMSIRSLDALLLLEGLLTGFESHLKSGEVWLIGANKITITEITDRFFNTVENKKGVIKHELKAEFIVGFTVLPIKLEIQDGDATIPVQIPFTLGSDCLPRNNLKNIEKTNPKIYLLTWKEEDVLRYVSIIQSDLGIGIWSNYFANRIILPKA